MGMTKETPEQRAKRILARSFLFLEYDQSIAGFRAAGKGFYRSKARLYVPMTHKTVNKFLKEVKDE